MSVRQRLVSSFVLSKIEMTWLLHRWIYNHSIWPLCFRLTEPKGNCICCHFLLFEHILPKEQPSLYGLTNLTLTFTGFLTSAMLPVWTGKFFIVGACSVTCWILRSIPGFHSRDANSASLPEAVTIKNGSRHCQIFRAKHQLKNTDICSNNTCGILWEYYTNDSGWQFLGWPPMILTSLY